MLTPDILHECSAGSVERHMISEPERFGLVRQEDGSVTCPACGGEIKAVGPKFREEWSKVARALGRQGDSQDALRTIWMEGYERGRRVMVTEQDRLGHSYRLGSLLQAVRGALTGLDSVSTVAQEDAVKELRAAVAREEDAAMRSLDRAMDAIRERRCPYCGPGECRSSAFTADGADVERFERLHGGSL